MHTWCRARLAHGGLPIVLLAWAALEKKEKKIKNGTEFLNSHTAVQEAALELSRFTRGA